MSSAVNVPAPRNEPVLQHAPGSPERAALKAALERVAATEVEIPLFIGGREIRTGRTEDVRMPHRHEHRLGRFHLAGLPEIGQAIEAAEGARKAWSETPFADRAAIFLRAAELLAGPRRAEANAATMLGQSKTCFQAEIDAACELVDFWRYNVAFAERILAEQPISPPGQWNQLDARPLEGFVLAVTPFNFTSIAGNLPTAPAIMGNTVVWKPASSAMLSAWHILGVLREAGLPDGVINFVAGSGSQVGQATLGDPRLGGVHFTGSTGVFQSMWKTVGENIARYKSYPRLVGETGGKDFLIAHSSADPAQVATAIVRGGFEYQGQKCSAVSRVYIADDIWPAVKAHALAELATIRMGDVADFRNFMGAVIDRGAFRSIASFVELGRGDRSVETLHGGKTDDREGWFIEPTLFRVEDPKHRLMCDEIFGPVVTLYVYPAGKWAETLKLVDETSPYALTGAVFARDRAVIAEAMRELRHAAGNFYINDKPTGAVVGQQPFGGARASGTNDKAGSLWNLIRWVSPRAIKETFDPPRHIAYPFMSEP